MISFKSPTEVLNPPLVFFRGAILEGHFEESHFPSDAMFMRSRRKCFLLSPDLEEYARRESDDIQPKYGLGWVLLAKIARKMHDAGTLEPRPTYVRPNPAEALFAKAHQQVRQEYASPRRSWWHRILIRLGLMGH